MKSLIDDHHAALVPAAAGRRRRSRRTPPTRRTRIKELEQTIDRPLMKIAMTAAAGRSGSRRTPRASSRSRNSKRRSPSLHARRREAAQGHADEQRRGRARDGAGGADGLLRQRLPRVRRARTARSSTGSTAASTSTTPTYSGAENRLPNGIEVRRARIGLKATLFTNWLAESRLRLRRQPGRDQGPLGRLLGFANSLIRLGNHKAPFGLETLTSSKYITFIERSYIDSWAPDRRLGVGCSLLGQEVAGLGRHVRTRSAARSTTRTR